MFKRLYAAFLLAFLVIPQTLAFSLPGSGEEVLPEEGLELAEELFEVQVNAETSVQAGKSLILEAFVSSDVDLGELTYEWALGDGNVQQGLEVVHSYSEPGDYEVSLLVRDALGREVSALHPVFVYEQSFALVTNVVSEQGRVQGFVDAGRNEKVHIDLIESYSSQSEFLAEEDLKRQIAENISVFEDNRVLVIWTEGGSGLTVLSQLQQSISDETFFKDKEIVFVSDENFKTLENIARGVFQSLSPAGIVLTRSESIWVLLEDVNVESFVEVLDARGIQYTVVDDKLHLAPWNIMTYFVNTMIDRGVPTNTIRLVLMLPIIVTVVAFMKQVVGFTTLGVYTPSILALSFIALDLSYGLLILFSILFIGTIVRLFLRRYRLLYIPRMAIVLTFVSLTILFLLFLGAYFDISNIVGIAVFPMLIMSTMVEKFVSIQSGKGLKTALTLVGEAVLVAILCYYVAEWGWLKLVVLGHPEVIFLFLLVNVFLARWTGLRLLEYVRFREIIRHAEE